MRFPTPENPGRLRANSRPDPASNNPPAESLPLIHLGTRAVLEYLLSPLQKAFHESARKAQILGARRYRHRAEFKQSAFRAMANSLGAARNFSLDTLFGSGINYFSMLMLL